MSFSPGIDYRSNSVRANVVDYPKGRELRSCVFDYPGGKHGILPDAYDHNVTRGIRGPFDRTEDQ